MIDNIPRLLVAILTTDPARPWCLDLFCGAGGAGMGYKLAGFNVLGVDIHPQPRYPGWFVQGDALEFAREYGQLFDLIHASPPCQRYSQAAKFKGTAHKHPDMVSQTRNTLIQAARPYVIENVPGSPLMTSIILRGNMFDLALKRDRLFECSHLLFAPPLVPMTGTAASHKCYSSFANGADYITVGGHNYNPDDGKEAMGIYWMANRAELSQAIPPAYTRYIGAQMMRVVMRNRAERAA